MTITPSKIAQSRFSVLVILATLLPPGLAVTMTDNSRPVPSDQVVKYLTNSIEWYRQLSIERQMTSEPEDLIYVEDNQALGNQILGLSFDFAKLDASLAAQTSGRALASSNGVPGAASSNDAEHFRQLETNAESEQRSATASLFAMRKLLVSAKGDQRRKLRAQIADIQDRIQLLRQRMSSLRDLLQFIEMNDSVSYRDSELGSAIDNLARAFPESAGAMKAEQNLTPIPNNSLSVTPSQTGLFGRANKLLEFQRQLRAIESGLQMTETLEHSSHAIHDPFAVFLHHSIEGAVPGSGDLQTQIQPENLDDTARLNTLTAEVKGASSALEALDKQVVLLAIYKARLLDWRNSILDRYKRALWSLIVRLAVLAFVVAAILLGASMLRSATERYVHDPNRCRMFLTLEVLLTWLVLILVIALAVAADTTSMATFLGLLSAGVAVALQYVILAVLGYFALSGKRGMKVGDLVTISGVTGEVINLGLLQFQIRELDGSSLASTNNVVTFSNSFIFISPQTGFSKVIPVDQSNIQSSAAISRS